MNLGARARFVRAWHWLVPVDGCQGFCYGPLIASRVSACAHSVSCLLCAEWSYILWVHSFFLLQIVLLFLVCFGFCSLLLEVLSWLVVL